MNTRTLKTTLGAAGLATVLCLGSAPRAFAHDADSMFQKMDTNGDGKLSREEHAAGAKMMFEKMDANNDGKVTPAEMDAAHSKMEDSHQKIEAKEGKEMSSADKIKAIDTNGDGTLSASESAAGADKIFDMMDTDKDGSLTKAELKAGHKAMLSKAHQAP